jgi:hypothetical protein
VREDRAVVSRVHYGGAALLQIRPNANVIQMVMEVGFGVERSKYPIQDAMIHHRASERVSEAIRCVIWDASELLDDGAEVICKLISLGVRHEMKTSCSIWPPTLVMMMKVLLSSSWKVSIKRGAGADV